MAAFPFLLGFKLPLGWRGDPRWDGTYDSLKSSRFDYVEFGVGTCAKAERELIGREATRCRAHGLGVSLHPYLGGQANAAHFGQAAEADAVLDNVATASAEVADITGRPVWLVLHPPTCDHPPGLEDVAALRSRLVKRSRVYFAEVLRRTSERGLPVNPVAEHQLPTAPGEPLIRIGDSCAELLDATAGVPVGLCWDTGHYVLGVERRGQAEPPPDEFVRRIEYVHLHDVIEGQDHRPVTSILPAWAVTCGFSASAACRPA